MGPEIRNIKMEVIYSLLFGQLPCNFHINLTLNSMPSIKSRTMPKMMWWQSLLFYHSHYFEDEKSHVRERAETSREGRDPPFRPFRLFLKVGTYIPLSSSQTCDFGVRQPHPPIRARGARRPNYDSIKYYQDFGIDWIISLLNSFPPNI